MTTLTQAISEAKDYNYSLRRRPAMNGLVELKRFGTHITWYNCLTFSSVSDALGFAKRDFEQIKERRAARRAAALQPQS